MKGLTINFRIIALDDYDKVYDEVLKEVSDIEGVEVNIKKGEEDSYLDYIQLLQRTETDYVVFYNDRVQIKREEIENLLKVLNSTEGMFFQQKVYTLTPELKEQTNLFMYFSSYVFRTDILKSLNLSQSPRHLYQEKILLDVTDRCAEAIPLKKCILYTKDVLESDFSSYEPQFKKEWYQEDLEQFLLPYLREGSPIKKEVQKRLFYSILLRFSMNLNAKEKIIIEGEEIDRFFSCTKEILQYIDDDVIVSCKEYCKMPVSFTYLFLKEKHNGRLKMSVRHENGEDRYYINDQWLENNFVSTRVGAINYQNRNLKFYCEIRGSFFINEVEKDFHVLVNGKETTYVKDGSYNIIKVFGRSVLRFYRFSFSIPESIWNKKTTICFSAKINDGHTIRTPMEFEKPSSRLIKTKWSYYAFADRIIVRNGNELWISKRKKTDVFLRECALIARAFLSAEDNKSKWEIAALRIGYWLTKNKYSKKKCWVFYDKLYKAGDNAEYLFDYCYENAKDVECYYIVTEAYVDYKRLKAKYGNHILKFESFPQRLITMHADIIFATQALVWGYCGFKGDLQRYCRNLLNAKIVCIQHGLTVQNIAQYQNKQMDNTSLYFCASKYEVDNLKRPIYGYNEDEIKLTGSPRYDGLINRDQRQILITPTWRRNIVITGNKRGTAKGYNPRFKNTEYFAIYNKLINDPALQEAARKYNYKLVYLLHPTLSSQIDDFDTNDYLSIVPAVSDVSYEKMLTESSLMLTDYSGVQFDFAYMKKPVLYYHPQELPPQYEESVYKYDTMGFGPVILEYDAIIEELCSYMKNNCQMKEEYRKRVDDFFAYSDHNNCKRIYDIVKV